MDPEVSLMYCPSGVKRITRSNLTVKLSSRYNRQTLPNPYEGRIEHIWSARLAANPTLWNGTKFRIDAVEEDEKGVVFCLGVTNYKDFLGTNWSPDAELYSRLGATDHNNTQAYMSDALGVGAFLVTSDEQVVFLLRGKHLAEAPGLWDIPGGHPEPEEIVGKIEASEIDVENMSTSAVVNEIFNSTIREIVHEVNIPVGSLTDPQLLGIARNTTSAGRPSSEYFVQCNLTSEEIEQRYSEGTQAEADETTRIKFIPTSHIQHLQSSHPDVWCKLAPSAKGCIMLYNMHGRPPLPFSPVDSSVWHI